MTTKTAKPTPTTFTHIEMVCNCCGDVIFGARMADLHHPSDHPRADWKEDGKTTCPAGELAMTTAGWMECDRCGSPGITVVLLNRPNTEGA